LDYRAKGGELQSVLDRDEIPEEEDVVRFLRQVLGGLSFLHQFDIAHLDLKVLNINRPLYWSTVFYTHRMLNLSLYLASEFATDGTIP